MVAILELGESIPLKPPLRKGMVLAFKSQRLDLTPSDKVEPTGLQLWNKANEVVLQILISRRRNAVIFNARATVSLLDGWGETEKISNIASSWKSTSKFTISVCDCGDQYQILFNLTPVYYFEKRFSINSSAVKASYRQESLAATLSQSLKVFVYDWNSLPASEKLAIQSTRLPLPKTASSVEPAGDVSSRVKKLIDDSPGILEILKWDGGNERRVYGIGPGNILQEYGQSAGSRNRGWYQGKLHKLGIVLNRYAGLAVLRLSGGDTRIFYQDPKSGVIQTLCHSASNKGPWVKGRTIATAVEGSSIAAVVCSPSNGYASNRVDFVYLYYQGLDLHLREQIWTADAGRWVSSCFDAGAQPKFTPISVIAKDGEVYVSWKDAKNQVVTISRSKPLGCGASDSAMENGNEQLDGRD